MATKPKPTLTLIDTRQANEAALVRAFEAMTGRKVTQAEIDEANRIDNMTDAEFAAYERDNPDDGG